MDRRGLVVSGLVGLLRGCDHDCPFRWCQVRSHCTINCVASTGLRAHRDPTMAGIDLRWIPYGEWYCFEVNHSPAFNFYQYHTGQPIVTAVTRLFMAGIA
jgi:hypothetical protein